jgi:hypothetical protein
MENKTMSENPETHDCFFCGETTDACTCTPQSRLAHSLDMLSIGEVADAGYVRMASGRYERICRPVERPFSRFIIDADPEAWVSLVNAYADELLRCPFENNWLPGDSIVAKEMAGALIIKRCADEDASTIGAVINALDKIIPAPFSWRRHQSTVYQHFNLLCRIVDQGLPITETDEIPVLTTEPHISEIETANEFLRSMNEMIVPFFGQSARPTPKREYCECWTRDEWVEEQDEETSEYFTYCQSCDKDMPPSGLPKSEILIAERDDAHRALLLVLTTYDNLQSHRGETDYEIALSEAITRARKLVAAKE